MTAIHLIDFTKKQSLKYLLVYLFYYLSLLLIQYPFEFYCQIVLYLSALNSHK